MKTYFITGVTGLLGPFLVSDLLDKEETNVIVLARKKEGCSAYERVEKVINELGRNLNPTKNLSRLQILEGDLRLPFLGLEESERLELRETVNHIIHCAANTDFSYPIDHMREINVKGTNNILSFGRWCHEKGQLEAIHHISTAYVVGKITGKNRFFEDELAVGQSFNNTYEQSKYEAEQLCHQFRKEGISTNIFRTSIIIGSSESGYATTFKTIYQLLYILSTGLFCDLPAMPSAILNAIPANEVARAILTIIRERGDSSLTYHIVNNNEGRFGDFVDFASTYFGFRIPNLIPVDEFEMDSLSAANRKLLQPFIPYMNYRISFDSSRAQEILRRTTTLPYSKLDIDLWQKIFRFWEAKHLRRMKENVSA